MENLNKSFEPMDVDLSSQSTSAMDISYENSEFETHNSVRDNDCFIIGSPVLTREKSPVPAPMVAPESPLPCRTTKQIHDNSKMYHIRCRLQRKATTLREIREGRRIKILGFFLVLFVSICFYNYSIFCYKPLDLLYLRETLVTQLFGQDEAVESVINALQADSTPKILFFYGGTGVGKTLTSKIIMDNLGPTSNLYHYTMPTFAETFSSNLMVGLSVCETTTLIVDDLNIDNNLSEQINQVIAKSDYLKRNLTIILIHNCASTDGVFLKKCDESVQSILSDNYKNSIASFFFIEFKTLTDFDLRKCINKELGDVKLDKLTYEKIVKKFNVTSDGCKGVHTKVKTLNIL